MFFKTLLANTFDTGDDLIFQILSFAFFVEDALPTM